VSQITGTVGHFPTCARSGRTDDRAELDDGHRHAGCFGTFGRSESAGLLISLEYLPRDAVRVVDGYEVGAQETG
jgi:hypothetical protein